MNNTKSDNITWHDAEVTSAERTKAAGQRGAVLWFTGLSGSGKSTLARRVEHLLLADGYIAYGLDGDNLRHGLNRDLGFSPLDRAENIRRIGEVAALFADAQVLCLTSFISPYQKDRDAARAMAPAGQFIEVYVATPLAVCEQRDPKGLYRKARAGEIAEFTGISAPYEVPEHNELTIDTAQYDLETCAGMVVEYLRAQGFLRVE